MIRKKLEEYLEIELNTFERQFMNENNSLVERSNLYWYAIQRGYGAIDFAMLLGLDQNIADKMNTWYRDNLEKVVIYHFTR